MLNQLEDNEQNGGSCSSSHDPAPFAEVGFVAEEAEEITRTDQIALCLFGALSLLGVFLWATGTVPAWDAVPWPHVVYSSILLLVTYLATRFSFMRYLIAIGPIFHPEVLRKWSMLTTPWKFKTVFMSGFILLHVIRGKWTPNWIFTWVLAFNIFWAGCIEFTEGSNGTHALPRYLNGILLLLVSFASPWFSLKGNQLGFGQTRKEIRAQGWFQLAYSWCLLNMHLFNFEWETNKTFWAAFYALVLPVVAWVIVGDVRAWMDARAYCLYGMFMLLAMQPCSKCTNDQANIHSHILPDIVHSHLQDCEWKWAYAFRHSNLASWLCLAVSFAVCYITWSKMILSDTLLGYAVSKWYRPRRPTEVRVSFDMV